MDGGFSNILMVGYYDSIKLIDTNDITEYHKIQLQSEAFINDIIKTKNEGEYALATNKGLRFIRINDEQLRNLKVSDKETYFDFHNIFCLFMLPNNYNHNGGDIFYFYVYQDRRIKIFNRKSK